MQRRARAKICAGLVSALAGWSCVSTSLRAQTPKTTEKKPAVETPSPNATPLPQATPSPQATPFSVPSAPGPSPAAGAMHPALGEDALRIGAHEQVFRPGMVVERIGLRRPRDMRLAAIAELDLVARPAPRARDQQHRMASFMRGGTSVPDCRARGANINAPRRRHRARRSARLM